MKNIKSIPYYSLSFLLLNIAIKLFLLIKIFFDREIEVSQIIAFPFNLLFDLITAFIIFFIFDLLLMKIKRFKMSVVPYIILNFLFFILIVYSLLMVKFYFLFGTFLSYGLLSQAHNVSSYSGGIINEIDIFVILLLIISIIYFSGIKYLQFIKSDNINNVKRDMFFDTTFLKKATIFFLIYLSTALILSNTYFKKINFFSIDKNPVFELAYTALAGEIIFNEKISPQNLYAKNRNIFNNNSIISPNKLSERILLKNNDLNFRRNLNVIFFKFESTTAQYTGLFNDKMKKYTKNLNKLSKQSLLLTNYYSHEPASLKALYSTITGKYSYQTRNWKEYLKRAKNDITLPEILRENGYDTVFFHSGNGRIYYLDKYVQNRFNTFIDQRYIRKKRMKFKKFSICYDDRVLIKLFDNYLKKTKGKFFAYLNPVFPHHPYMIPLNKFNITGGKRKFDRYKNALYFSDYIIGEINNLLKKHGIANNTIFVIFADHGEAFYQHPGNYLHSIYLYEENVRTFCLISNPQLFNNTVYGNASGHVDLVPTILSILNIKTKYKFHGTDLTKNHFIKFVPFFTSFSDEYIGIRDKNWKYIINMRYNSEELFNLDEDLAEKKNLSKQFPEICNKFRLKAIEVKNVIN